ncbi:hypothetical protein GCM10027275_42840 [Rhabdobacter roseus]|uniref:Metal-dependent hydrolase (Beta-lactamase superfamily II) n=1 Tax=Rhabdobacter roseus TaxID=1655419 RepID=A0A840TYH1_9BACT|nr:MBL fold metallo-hydrolase [Rhabdobacter roseus]MBB5286662.1 metal-dependent hydrolase (beta-lactamase superfamily II) [Rhabdobacter roseus]
MRVRFYQVECGDAASISYEGDDGNVHYLFLDAGYERTYRDILADEVKTIGAAGGQIDIWVISHIHDDHIGGIIAYLKAIEKGEAEDIVSKWWYNHPHVQVKNAGLRKCINAISEAKSFAKGEQLTSYLVRTGHLPQMDMVQLHTTTGPAGLKVTVLSPTARALQQLREKYRNTSLRALDYHELTAISEPTASKASDYHQKVDSFVLDAFTEDTSIENGSSIAVLIEQEKKKVLWLADALPSTIMDALRDLGYSADHPLEVDLVKVSHHGSCGNNSSALYSLIRCNTYVFCASGDNKHQLPTKECLVRILKNQHRPEHSEYAFLFTHDNATLRSIFDVDGSAIFKSLRFKMSFSASKCLEVHC